MSELDKGAKLKSPDSFKGLVIIVIVMAHIFLATDRASGGVMPPYLQALYLGLMGFFIISGYFYRSGRGFKENFLKRFKQIVIPILVATATLPLFMYLYLNLLGYGLPIDGLISSIVWECGFGDPFLPVGGEIVDTSLAIVSYGNYYLLTMVWGFLYFYAIADRVLDDFRKTFAAIAILLTIAVVVLFLFPVRIPTYPILGLMGASFMLFGAFLARQNYIEVMESVGKKKTFYLFPAVGLIAGIGMCYILPPGTGFDMYVFGDHGAFSAYPFFIEASLMFLPIIFIAYLLTKVSVLFTVLSTVGRHTIAILLLHPVLLKAMSAPFYEIEPVWIMPSVAPMWFKLVAGVIAIVVCVIIGHLLGKLLAKLQERASKE